MNVKLVLLGIVFLFMSTWAQAQDFDRLRKQIQARQADARQQIVELKDLLITYEKNIDETEKKYSTLEKQYNALEREIRVREEIVSQLGKEKREIMSEIRLTQENYDKLEKELNELVSNYKKSLAYLYKHGRNSDLALMFTSSSLNQMMIRSYYLGKFEDYRQKQAEKIEEGKQELRRKSVELQETRARNEQVQKETLAEKNQLEKRKKEQEQTIALLKRDRRELSKKLRETNDQLNNFNTTLSELANEEERIRIAESVRLRKLEEERLRRLAEAKKIMDENQRNAEVEKYSTPVANSDLTVLPDLSEIESSFISARGALPWPVEQGIVAAKFGTKVHPVYRTKIENPGIEIATEPGSEVRAVHDGYVLSVQPIAGFGDVVVVNHGRYKSVYGNLSEVKTFKNAPIKKGDVVGLSGDENSAKGPVLFFMIWEKGKNTDPEQWIAKK